MQTMRVFNSRVKTLCTFQKGVTLSCYSLIGMFDMVKSLFGVTFILTQRLNQDCLESFFGCIRQMSGSHDHPDAVNFKFRIRKFLLGKDMKLPSENTNSDLENEDLDPMSNSLVSRGNRDKKIIERSKFGFRDLLDWYDFQKIGI